jgi:hypothetical protein
MSIYQTKVKIFQKDILGVGFANFFGNLKSKYDFNF